MDFHIFSVAICFTRVMHLCQVHLSKKFPSAFHPLSPVSAHPLFAHSRFTRTIDMNPSPSRVRRPSERPSHTQNRPEPERADSLPPPPWSAPKKLYPAQIFVDRLNKCCTRGMHILPKHASIDTLPADFFRHLSRVPPFHLSRRQKPFSEHSEENTAKPHRLNFAP